MTPLYIAAYEGHEAVVRALIEAGADVGVAAPGKPVYITVEKGHETVVRILIEAGADVNKAINIGVTSLFMACRRASSASWATSSRRARTSTRRRITAGRRCLWPLEWATQRLFSFSGRPARCDDGNAGVCCFQTGWKRTARATRDAYV